MRRRVVRLAARCVAARCVAPCPLAAIGEIFAATALTHGLAAALAHGLAAPLARNLTAAAIARNLAAAIAHSGRLVAPFPDAGTCGQPGPA